MRVCFISVNVCGIQLPIELMSRPKLYMWSTENDILWSGKVTQG